MSQVIKHNYLSTEKLCVLLFLLIGSAFVIKVHTAPIADFGNYYYGSKLFLNNLFTKEMYTSIHYFNAEIQKLGEKNYFENYIPVPPISALVYAPCCMFKPLVAKTIFNLLGLLLFCYSLYQFLIFSQLKKSTVLLLPILFIYPFYSTIYQGQAYLLITAFLLLAFLQSERHKTHLPALLLAFCIALKLFPIFMVLYFLVRKKYKLIFCTLGYLSLMLLATTVFISPEIVTYYFINIVPRLSNNDIVGSYSAINQSIYSLLLHLFTENKIENIVPLVNFPLLVPVLESCVIAYVFNYIYTQRNSNTIFLFGLVLLSSTIVNRYNPSYSLILILPFLSYFLNQLKFNFIHVLLVLLFLTGLNLPIGALINFSLVLKFSRILMFFVIFLLILKEYKAPLKLKPVVIIFLVVCCIKYFTFSVEPTNYFQIQNSKGILYDIDLKNDSLILKNTFGEKNITEQYKLNGKANFDNRLSCIDNELRFNDNIICVLKDNKCKPFIYNDSLVVFMSDLNQGVRFYRLRVINLKAIGVEK